MTEVSRKDVEDVARLARLRFSQDEITAYQRELGAVLGFMEKLKELDLRNVEPAASAAELTNVFREDVPTPRPSLGQDGALRNAPESKDGFFTIPRVVEDA